MSLNWPSVLQAPTQFPLHESSLAIAALLATFGPPESLTQLAGSRPYLEGLLRVGRNSLRVAAEHLAGAPQAEPQYRAGCATMPGCPSVLAILAALAGTGVDPGWTALPLHWEFLGERPTLGLLRDVVRIVQEARKAAMTPIPGSIAVLHEAATLGTVSLLSNNPIPFKDSLPVLTPEIVGVLQDNDLVSAVLGARKPERRIYTRALGRFGVKPSDAILFDDSLANVEGARECGMHAHHVTKRDDGTFDTDAMLAAAHAFAAR